MAFGFILGFHSHFGIVLSLLSILIYLFFIKPIRPNIKICIITLLILIIGLLPNLIFDLTHNFINVKKIFNVVEKNDVLYYVPLSKIVNVLNINATSLIYPRFNNMFDSLITKSLFALILVNAISLFRDKRFKNLSLLLLTTAIFPTIFFYLQQGKFSEYYLMMTIPSLILLFALFIKRIIEKKLLLFFMIIVSVWTNSKDFMQKYVIWNLNAKESVVKRIIEKGGYDNYGISLTTSLGNNFGFRYLLDYYGVKAEMPPKKGETKIFSIIIPEGFDGMVGMETCSGIGLRWEGI